MSTQLILLPQTHLGINSSTGVVEMVSDGAIFSSLSSATTVPSSAAAPLTYLLTVLSGGLITNTWYGWKTTAVSGIWLTPAIPSVLLGNLVLNTVGDSSGKTSGSGVIQKLSSLNIGGLYTVEVKVSNTTPPTLNPTHSIRIVIYDGSTIIASTTAPNGFVNGSLTANFTAISLNTIITVSNYDNVNGDVVISSISVQGGSGTLGLNNGQVICDLYQEEDIPLTLSIDDFKNVTEQVKSYSKDFNLPATKRNNRIFNNMFDVTRADDGMIFNPYVKTACLLKQDGFIIFEGYLRLIDVKDKDGEISYNVNLYSEVISLADVLKDRTFSQLEFSELNHDYTFSNIKYSWQGILNLTNPLPTGTFAGTAGATTTGVLKYPYIDWNHQFSIDTSGNPVLSNLEAAFRPCIKLKYLIQNIFAATDFNYTSDFFDSAEFDRLYMDFNWGANNAPVASTNTFSCNGGQGTHYAGTSYTNFVLDNTGLAFFVFPPNYDSTTNIITATAINETYNINYKYTITNTDTVTRTVECRYLKNTADFDYSGIITLAAGTSYVYQGNLNVSLNTGDTLQAQFKASSAGVVQQAIGGGGLSFGTNVIFIVNILAITADTLLQTLRGELGQWDFLKGIMTMFNLVSMKDENNPANILIEPYNDVFLTNPDTKELDWTDKVDVSEMELKPLTDLNKNTIFKFVEDDDDYAFSVYKNSTGGHLYGSKKLDASTSGTTNGRPTVLQGTKEIVAEPFAATVSKQLESQYSDFIVPAIYTVNDDLTSEGFDNSPRIFYENWYSPNGVVDLTSCTYSVPAQNGGAPVLLEDEFLQFSHLSAIPANTPATDKDFVFESAQLFPGVGLNSPIDNLYNTYWAAYFGEVYHPDTRIMTLKVNLTPSDLATFKFYDKVFIRNRIFRVNKIEYKPNSLAKVEFILIP